MLRAGKEKFRLLVNCEHFSFYGLQKGLTKIPRAEGTPTYLLYFSVDSNMH